jgi:hypothetical protein
LSSQFEFYGLAGAAKLGRNLAVELSGIKRFSRGEEGIRATESTKLRYGDITSTPPPPPFERIRATFRSLAFDEPIH